VAKKTVAPSKKLKLKLTAEQQKALAEVFGTTFVSRVKTIDLEQIEGYVAATVKVN
jgi:hypothetical protein